MKINTEALKSLAGEKGWSVPELAARLDVEYSYLYRVIHGEKNGGSKLFGGVYNLCKNENLDVEDYIFFNEPLSANNKTSTA